MAEIIATRTDLSHYAQRVVLDGREYQLTLQWNEREGKWYLSLFTVDGVALAHSIKVVVGHPLLRLLRTQDAPPGEISALDRSGSGRDPGLSELGTRVILVYHPASELVA